MAAQILPSSQGPVVIYEGLVLHMSDTEGMICAVDDTPNLLQDLEKLIIEHLLAMVEFSKENFLTKKNPHTKLVLDALTTMNNFYKFASTEYVNYLHNRTQQNNPQMNQPEVERETRRLNRDDINDFYALKQQ
jgi:hypothetical protein